MAISDRRICARTAGGWPPGQARGVWVGAAGGGGGSGGGGMSLHMVARGRALPGRAHLRRRRHGRGMGARPRRVSEPRCGRFPSPSPSLSIADVLCRRLPGHSPCHSLRRRRHAPPSRSPNSEERRRQRLFLRSAAAAAAAAAGKCFRSKSQYRRRTANAGSLGAILCTSGGGGGTDTGCLEGTRFPAHARCGIRFQLVSTRSGALRRRRPSSQQKNTFIGTISLVIGVINLALS